MEKVGPILQCYVKTKGLYTKAVLQHTAYETYLEYRSTVKYQNMTEIPRVGHIYTVYTIL